MYVFRPKYKDKKTGQAKLCQKYRIEFIDKRVPPPVRRRLTAFTSKRESERAAEKIEWLLDGLDPRDPDVQRWIGLIPHAMKMTLNEFGLIDLKQAEAKKLSLHIKDFGDHLLAAGRTQAHAHLTAGRVSRVFSGCGFLAWSDISASNLQTHLMQLRNREKKVGGISVQTSNYYLQACKQFGRFMVLDRRTASSPIEHLKGITVLSTDRKVERRALDVDEIRRLLESTRAAEKRFGMTGNARSVLYRLAIETGLRANELRSLIVSSFDLEGCMVDVVDAYSKNRRVSTIDLRPETAAMMQEFLRDKLPTAQAFHLPSKYNMASMLKADLEDVDIPYIDEAGRTVDFHSLRHTCSSLLADAGVNQDLNQEIMRHATPGLTRRVYTHIYRGRTSEAIAKLPDLSAPSNGAEQQDKTETA